MHKTDPQLELGKVRLPVIGLTASFQRSDIDYYHDVGMNECLGKPFRMEQLKKAIASAMQATDGVGLLQ